MFCVFYFYLFLNFIVQRGCNLSISICSCLLLKESTRMKSKSMHIVFEKKEEWKEIDAITANR